MEIVPTVFGENLLFGISMKSMKNTEDTGKFHVQCTLNLGQYDISFPVQVSVAQMIDVWIIARCRIINLF